jgi:hypothetical protein
VAPRNPALNINRVSGWLKTLLMPM